MTENQRHEQLLEAIGRLHAMQEEQLAEIKDLLQHCTEVVREAVEELGVIRDLEEEKFIELQWAVRNERPIFALKDMPKDAASEDWRINELSDEPPDDLKVAEYIAERLRPPPEPAHSDQKELF